MNRNEKVFFATSAISFVGSLILSRILAKRTDKRDAQYEQDRKIAFAYAQEQLEMVSEDLDRRIAIARKVLEQDDINQALRDSNKFN
jgi:hypothetical protein